MRKIYLFLVAIIIFYPFSASFAETDVECFYGEFTKKAGAPVISKEYFWGIDGNATVKIYNGGVLGEFKKTSSAIIKINDFEIFVPSDFNQNVEYLEDQIMITEGLNQIQIKHISTPQSKICVSITQKMDKEQARNLRRKITVKKVADAMKSNDIYSILLNFDESVQNLYKERFDDFGDEELIELGYLIENAIPVEEENNIIVYQIKLYSAYFDKDINVNFEMLYDNGQWKILSL